MPEGTVTFLFSDLEGSTGMLERYGGAAAGTALERHHRLYEELVDRNTAGCCPETRRSLTVLPVHYFSASGLGHRPGSGLGAEPLS